MPGIRRIGSGRTFRYIGPNGQIIRDPETLRRIRSLVIPPAWIDVWICPLPEGHLQATGRDARRRKQYRYHLRWREIRDTAKFERMAAFGKALATIRRRVKRDLARTGLSREQVLATVVRLLETTLIRIGNEEYTRQNKSFGLTTLRNHHVNVTPRKIYFYFRGKSGKKHAISVEDPYLAKIVRRLRDLPGYELFQYVDEDGQPRSIGSTDVNDYLREITGEEFSSKDFRTWSATMLAVQALCECALFETQKQAKKNVNRMVENVARRLGNTEAVCRKCYIHPEVFEAYTDGRLATLTERFKSARARSQRERMLIRFLEKTSKTKRKTMTLKEALAKSIRSRRKHA